MVKRDSRRRKLQSNEHNKCESFRINVQYDIIQLNWKWCKKKESKIYQVIIECPIYPIIHKILINLHILYQRNGYAEQLQKLLIRQSSNLNLLRHNITKENNQQSNLIIQFSFIFIIKNFVILKVKKIDNVLKLLAFYKQVSFHKQFYLIHAIDLNKLRDNSISYVYILISNDTFDSSRVLEASDKKNCILNIYPPWSVSFFL